MNTEDRMQQNIRRTTGLIALKKIRAIVDEEIENDASAALVLIEVAIALRLDRMAGLCRTAGTFNRSVLIGRYLIGNP